MTGPVLVLALVLTPVAAIVLGRALEARDRRRNQPACRAITDRIDAEMARQSAAHRRELGGLL